MDVGMAGSVGRGTKQTTAERGTKQTSVERGFRKDEQLRMKQLHTKVL